MRSAVNQAKNAEGQANNAAGTYTSAGQADQNQLTPFLSKELNTEHGYSPNQLNQLLTAAGAGTGGAAGSLNEEAKLNAARTNNSAGISSIMDSMARSKDQALAKASEGIAGQDVNLAKEMNQEGAKGLTGLAGMNTDAALKSMGLETQDINAEAEASKSGWFQNMTGLMGSLAGAGAKGVSL